MRLKHWVAFIAVNIVISATVTLALLMYWESTHPSRITQKVSQTTVTPAPVQAQSTAALPSTAVAQPPAPTLLPDRSTIYIVQRGDTLSAISRRFGVPVSAIVAANNLDVNAVLSVGQQVVIPTGGEPLPTLTPAPTLTPLPSELVQPPADVSVEIRQVISRGDPAKESIVIANLGRQVSLEGWRLSNNGGEAYTFPNLTLWPGGTITVHTGSGPDSVSDLYWKRIAPAWAEPGDVVTLTNADGNVVARYQLP